MLPNYNIYLYERGKEGERIIFIRCYMYLFVSSLSHFRFEADLDSVGLQESIRLYIS